MRDRWLRRGYVAAWAIIFGLGGMAVASAWDPLVEGLVRRPVPATTDAAPAASLPAATAGEQAVLAARKHLEQGRPAEAMDVLLRVKPEEPVYPFSLQLREEARRALERARQGRR